MLVNNAGATRWYPNLENCGLKEWEYIIQLNLTAAFLFIKHLKDCLINCCSNKSSSLSSSIINIGSVSCVNSSPDVIAYSVAKAGLTQSTKCVALELSSFGVRCNIIQPAALYTKFQEKANVFYSQKTKTQYYNRINKRHPLGRIGTTNDIIRKLLCFYKMKNYDR